MRKYSATNRDYTLFKQELNNNHEKYPWIKGELELLESFVVKADRETALQQVIMINKKYSTHLSFGKSKMPDESEVLSDFIISDSFLTRIDTKDVKVAVALVNDFREAAQKRGRDLLSFVSKYCHHCNPNMFPIYDSINVKYLKDHYSYTDERDYEKYVESYLLFCKSIDVDLEHTTDKAEGFWVDKFINNIEK